jgi:uncharacterized spore protein YtfJ
MENVNFIENIATRLGQSATVKNVYGEPIVRGDRTIVPVARVSYGFGGGFGKKGKNKNTLPEGEKEGLKEERGAGGGGGLNACASGVYEITDKSTRFIPANNTKQLLVAALVGFLIRGWLKR